MAKQIEYRLMDPGEEGKVINLVSRVFNEFVAPLYSAEGVTEYYRYANAAAMAQRSKSNHFTIIAEQEADPVGMIETRNHNHIALFFVKSEFQRKGIGKQLLKQALDICFQNNPKLRKITVHSSPNSVGAYEQMGFIPEDKEQLVNGMRYVPMSLKIEKK